MKIQVKVVNLNYGSAEIAVHRRSRNPRCINLSTLRLQRQAPDVRKPHDEIVYFERTLAATVRNCSVTD